MENKLGSIKKTQFKGKEGEQCVVEINKKFYRAKFIKENTGANLVQLTDTGSYKILGKNRIKNINEDDKVTESKIKCIELTSIVPEKYGELEFELMLKEVQQLCNKEATLEIESGNKEAGRIIIDGECLSTFLVKRGYAYVQFGFKDNDTWGVNITKAQEEAKESHLNIWKFGDLRLD